MFEWIIPLACIALGAILLCWLHARAEDQLIWNEENPDA